MKNKRASAILLALIFTAIILGILQGLPETIEALGDVLSLR